jgi:hypothetical protein
MSDLVKVTLNITKSDLRHAKGLAARRNTSITQIFLEALRTEEFIQGQLDDGATLVARKGHRGRDIVFPHMLARPEDPTP